MLNFPPVSHWLRIREKIQDGAIFDLDLDPAERSRSSRYQMSLLGSLQHNPAMLKTCSSVIKALFPVTLQVRFPVSIWFSFYLFFLFFCFYFMINVGDMIEVSLPFAK